MALWRHGMPLARHGQCNARVKGVPSYLDVDSTAPVSSKSVHLAARGKERFLWLDC
jgi:hypothetical protein